MCFLYRNCVCVCGGVCVCVCLGVDKDLFFPSYRLVGAAISDTLSHVIRVLVSAI